MRISLVLAIIVTLQTAALGDDVFGNWMIFPGPNPEVGDLLPDADSDLVFRIGQILFDYPSDRIRRAVAPVTEIEKLPSVAVVVKAATPGPALTELVKQQLASPHTFHFETATVEDRGDAGYRWHVISTLFPATGGSSGSPYRYRAVMEGEGKLIRPRLTIFDAFCHSPKEGWTTSTLSLGDGATPSEAAISEEKIRDSATKQLNAPGRSPEAMELSRRMVYHSQELVKIPIAEDAAGKVRHAEIWAVNFRDPSRSDRKDEVFSVWVTRDGQVSTIQHLDLWQELVGEKR